MQATEPLVTRHSSLATSRFNETPVSITDAQKRKLILAARDAGLSVDDVRALCPEGSIRQLSRAEAAAMIEKFVGHGLPEPAAAVAPASRRCPRRRPTPGTIRMITAAHVAQINQLLDDIFRTEEAGSAWLKRTWCVNDVWKLGTARNAGKLIAQLKRKIEGMKPAWHG